MPVVFYSTQENFRQGTHGNNNNHHTTRKYAGRQKKYNLLLSISWMCDRWKLNCKVLNGDQK